MNEGYVLEAMNIASLWRLPIIYICENNLYAMSGRVSDMTRTKHLADRVNALGIASETRDGNDVLAVYETVKKAVTDIKKNKQGPLFIEFETYRQSGHSINDKRVYRSREEEERWLSKDPIQRFERYLVEHAIVTKNGIQKMENIAHAEMVKVIENAKQSPMPDKLSISRHLYV